MVFREESGGNNERIGQYRFEHTFDQIEFEYISLFHVYQFSSISLP